MENRKWYAVVHIDKQNCIGWYSKLDQAEKRQRRTTAPHEFEIVPVREILDKGLMEPLKDCDNDMVLPDLLYKIVPMSELDHDHGLSWVTGAELIEAFDKEDTDG